MSSNDKPDPAAVGSGSTDKDPMYNKRTALPDTDPMERGDSKAPPQVKPTEKYHGRG